MDNKTALIERLENLYNAIPATSEWNKAVIETYKHAILIAKEYIPEVQPHVNYGILPKEGNIYPVIYTDTQDGKRVFKPQTVDAGDLTENQIKYLYECGYFNQDTANSHSVKDVEWTSVEDRLPDNEEEVIIFSCKHGDLNGASAVDGVAWYNKGKWNIVDSQDGLVNDIENSPDNWKVTHWMPLPLPPKK